METPKITKVELELDAVSGELRTMHDLLNIFANWFDETHKAGAWICRPQKRYFKEG